MWDCKLGFWGKRRRGVGMLKNFGARKREREHEENC